MKPIKNNIKIKKYLNILELKKKKNYLLDYLCDKNIDCIKSERLKLKKVKQNYDNFFNHIKKVTLNKLDNYMNSDDVLL